MSSFFHFIAITLVLKLTHFFFFNEEVLFNFEIIGGRNVDLFFNLKVNRDFLSEFIQKTNANVKYDRIVWKM